ncbi:MAG: helix-turn-helix transcriptional regulator [Desulfatibacillum sp.]|nr:helix-turn-helix transcriptional regulator [Desulfatibacillum sp.]
MDTKDIPSVNNDFFEGLTGKISAEDSTGLEDVGKRIQAIRTQRGLSLQELSQMTGFEVDVLEGIENNTIHPQLGTVMRLSKALDSALSRLISGQGNKPYEITRRGERKSIARSTSGKGGKKVYSYHALAHDVHGRNMEPLMVELEEDREAEMSVHEGEEFIFVLEGMAHLKVGEDSFDLEPGDSAYYLSTTTHSITGKGGKATILAVLFD